MDKEKKKYQTPKLRPYGNVEQITLGRRGPRRDGRRGRTGNWGNAHGHGRRS